MRIIAGLGNPGRQYERTRHNIGFIVVDELAKRWSVDEPVQRGSGDGWKKERGARTLFCRARDVLLVQPQTFMNDSGTPLLSLATFYKVPPQQMLVVVDDLDRPFGKLRMRVSGSSGGQNGLKSIIENLGEDFPRLRVGIGRDGNTEAISRVLGRFSPDEEAQLGPIVDACIQGITLWTERTPIDAINFVNSWKPATLSS
jgi:PTH1 family peptidyl-tRNA hydrolase